MPARRVNPYRVKLHYSYSVGELASLLKVHKNTVRNWLRAGLEPIHQCRPLLFQGATVRAFLSKCNKARKRPCSPGTLYCLRCRQPRRAALGMIDYIPMTDTSGNLRAICEHCETIMHRRVSKGDLARAMPGYTVQMPEDQPSISGKRDPSPNCDLETRG
jgi:hypothetical protein